MKRLRVLQKKKIYLLFSKLSSFLAVCFNDAIAAEPKSKKVFISQNISQLFRIDIPEILRPRATSWSSASRPHDHDPRVEHPCKNKLMVKDARLIGL